MSPGRSGVAAAAKTDLHKRQDVSDSPLLHLRAVHQGVSKAYFSVIRASQAPQGVAGFWIETTAGSRIKINLRTFPAEAAAVLFRRLEAHGIQIEVPNLWAARRLADQIRKAQAKLPMDA